jgi:hypothetical protein
MLDAPAVPLPLPPHIRSYGLRWWCNLGNITIGCFNGRGRWRMAAVLMIYAVVKRQAELN